MTPKRAAAWTLVAALTAAWLASAAGVIGPPAPARRLPVRSQLSAQTEAVSFDVQAQAERLRKRLATAPTPRPVRNPFMFEARQSVRSPAVARRVDVPAAALAVGPAEIEPEMTLIGVAEYGKEAEVVRTAMIVGAGDQLFLVRVGQSVGRYQVTAIGADAVELRDSASDRVRLLGLK
jgi:hypothetical protein